MLPEFGDPRFVDFSVMPPNKTNFMENYHSNQRRPYGHQPYSPQPRPFIQRPPETILAQQKLIVERKSYHISKRENQRGQFFVVSEERAASPHDRPGIEPRRNRIIIPHDGISDFLAAFQKVIAT